MMVKIGKFAGVPLFLTDNLFIFTIAFVVVELIRKGLYSALTSFVAIVFLAVCITLHEYGHILMAKCFDVHAKRVMLNFFGGIAENDTTQWQKLMDRPTEAMLIWVAGPAVNILLALIFSLCVYLLHGHKALLPYSQFAFTSNIVLAIFNLLPFYPLDGGGILYSAIRLFTTKAKAIKVASVISMVGSCVLFVLGIYGRNFILAIISVGIFLSAKQASKSKMFV
jgi:Zn-dependent protease